MNKKIIGIIGYFAVGLSKSGGQEVKTCSISEELCRIYGKGEVEKIDTLNWRKHPVRFFVRVVLLGLKCKNVVILPAHKGIRVLAPILLAVQKCRYFKIHYAVIGGWLPSMTSTNKRLKRMLQQFDYIYVETSSMKKSMEEQNFKNIVLFPNFKHITPIEQDDISDDYEEPYRLCFFARITEEKGLSDIVDAVLWINAKYDKDVFTLDIYGPVQRGQEYWFAELRKKFGKSIQYRGVVEPDESVTVLKTYFGLVFPTHYKTEGIPGTILDAYSAGIPVISSRWDNCGDLLDEGKTGYGYELGDIEELIKCLEKVYDDPYRFISMKINCIKKAENFSPDKIVKIMTNNIVCQ